jgi:hypothetical protein
MADITLRQLTRVPLLIYSLIFLSACTERTESRQISWAIEVDGKSYKPSAPSKATDGTQSDLELRIKIASACSIGHLAVDALRGSQVDSSSYTLESVPSVSAIQGGRSIKTGAQSNTAIKTTLQMTPLQIEPDAALILNQQISQHLCVSLNKKNQECGADPRRQSRTMPDDHLQLLSYMKDKFGMAREASIVYQEVRLSADKKMQTTISGEVALNKKTLSCSIEEKREYKTN